MGLSETFSKNYKIIRDYVKHHASTPINTNVDPTITDQSYNPDYIVKSIKQQQKTLTEYEIQSIIQKYQNGASSYDLAKEFGCHRRTITDALKRNGIEVSHRASTKPELVKKVIELYAEMKTPKEVGTIVGLDCATVRQLLKDNGIYIRKACMLLGICACSNQSEDLAPSSSRQETESSGELTADSILGTWTLELIMPDGEENITRQIRAESDYKMYFIEEDGSEEEFKWELGNKSNLTLFNYSTDAYFSGTYSVSENTITLSVNDYDYGVQPVDIAWQEKTYTITDEDGYVIQTSLKISPWIKQDNTELLDGAWNEISNEEFPSLSRMGISEGHLSKTYGLDVNWSEIVYAVGTLEAFNMTDGFDITSSNSHDTFFILGGARPEMMMYVAYGNQGELFYNVNNTGTAVFSKSALLGIGASMQTNHWGPVPFVIAYALEKTPNYPDGNPAPKDCVFAFGGTGGRFVSFDQKVISEDEFHLDITW